MAGTEAGGKKAAQKTKQKIQTSTRRLVLRADASVKLVDFAANPELARIAGAKGGRISRRRKADDSTKTA